MENCFGVACSKELFGGIWKERNLRIFKGKNEGCWEVIDAITREVGSWLMVTREFKVMSLSQFVHETCILRMP